MINDKIRTDSYRNFIVNNGNKLFKDKVVLDVGAGSCVLSLFASEAGAKHVYAVEASSELYAMGLDTLHANNMMDRITLVHGKMEEIELPVDKVDVIISEWMGFLLVYESMLDSVLYAGRKYLADDGAIYPRHYSINLLLVECNSALRLEQVDMWNSVYGYKMPAMRKSVLSEAVVLDVTSSKYSVKQLGSHPVVVHCIDLKDRNWMHYKKHSCDPCSFKLEAAESGNMDALLAYFDCDFDEDAESKVAFSTGPFAPYTHWKQVLCFLDEPLKVSKGDVIHGTYNIKRSKVYDRGLTIEASISINDNTRAQTFTLL